MYCPAMVKVRYIYSACVVLETRDIRVLCDPWFTEGAYDGAWYQYPKLEDPLNRIGVCDLVYVSHIHPDHYDPTFLRAYLEKYPKAKVIIANFSVNFLSRKMKADGIPHEIFEEKSFGNTELKIFPNESSKEDVDSALVIKDAEHAVVNMNDNLYNFRQLEDIKSYCDKGIKIALLGYTGAGPYPQTYYDDPKKLMELAAKKKEDFFIRYKKSKDILSPQLSIPFAGKYILGGRLASLNAYRGVADAVEVLDFDPSAVVLDDGGDAYIDTIEMKPSRIRTEKYPSLLVSNYCSSLSVLPMPYEKVILFKESEIPFERLLRSAHKNASSRSPCETDYYFCIKLEKTWCVINAKHSSKAIEFKSEIGEIESRTEISIDYRYLFGLLTCIYHWNNAEIGSQYFSRRTPDVFNRQAQGFLNYLHV